MTNKPDTPVPSRKLGNDKDLPGLMEQILNDYIKDNLDDMLPALVVSFDGEKNQVEIQPLIRMLQSDGVGVSRGTLTVPVVNSGTNKMSLRFSLSKGDLGWIKANDRDISLFLQSLSEENPNTLRRHQFSDAVFMPDCMRGMSFTADAIMSNASGSVKTEWFSDKIVHTAPTVEVVGDFSVSGAIVGGTIETEAGISLDDHTHDGSPTAPDGPITPTGAPL